MGILGAVIGDISGSQYEFDRLFGDAYKTCPLISARCSFTDDTVMSLAIKSAVDNGLDYESEMRRIGRHYMGCGYGGRFYHWMKSDDPKPYGSYGNGSAMRVSYIGEFYDDYDKMQEEAKKTALVTHDHPEGIKGAVVTATCVWMAKHGKSKDEIYDYVLKEYPSDKYEYSIDRAIADYRDEYEWNETCMGSVSTAMRCFYESDSYESFLRNVYSLNCDADTLAAIGGAVAEEFYGIDGIDVPKVLKEFLTDELYEIMGEYRYIEYVEPKEYFTPEMLKAAEDWEREHSCDI